MSTKETSRLLITLARKGKYEGENMLKATLAEAVKMQLDLDYNEKPYFRSALWEATWKNHEVIVKALAEKGATVDFRDYQGRTPLHEAAYYGHVGLCEFLLEKGAVLEAMDQFGQTPLFRAVEAGRCDVVEFLVKRKASTNIVDNEDCTPQHIASFQGHPDLSKWLLYKGSYKHRFSLENRDTEGTFQERAPMVGHHHADGAFDKSQESARKPKLRSLATFSGDATDWPDEPREARKHASRSFAEAEELDGEA